jgi:hypothetical protein
MAIGQIVVSKGRADDGTVTAEADEFLAFLVIALREPLIEWLAKGASSMSISKH